MNRCVGMAVEAVGGANISQNKHHRIFMQLKHEGAGSH